MSETLLPTTTHETAQEAGSLASDLAQAYGRMVRFYRDQLHLNDAEADTRARGANDPPDEAAADLDRIRNRPPDQVSWFDLNRVADRDPETMAEFWQGLREAAREELASGHRTARALDWDGHPWDRARFLAIRDSFRADYDPRPGMESALVDLAAEAFGDYLAWSEQLHMQAVSEVDLERHDLERHGAWKPPRIGSAEAMERSARMADRAYLRFMRMVKTLQDQRRPGPVHIQQAGQVNLGAQQVIVSQMGQGEGE